MTKKEIKKLKKRCKEVIKGYKKLADERFKKLYDYYIDKPQCEVDLKMFRELEDSTIKEQQEPWKLCLKEIKKNKKLKKLLRRWKKFLEPFPIVPDLKALTQFMKDSPHGTEEDAKALHEIQKKLEKKNRKLYNDTDEALNMKES